MSDTPEPIADLARWLREAQRCVVLTGAGISTESGIPDFRSPGGVWSRYRTVYYDEFLASAEARHEYWRQKAEMHREFADAAPNAGHRLLAAWERDGRVRGVVTQNIDGLHQLAGSRRVLELHGTAREAACQDCHERQPIGPLVNAFLAEQIVPPCAACGGERLKHATVSFGQALPADTLAEAAAWCREADLCLVLGSSLVVSPAADLPGLTLRSGGRLAIINREPTPYDAAAHAVIHAPLGETLAAVDVRLRD